MGKGLLALWTGISGTSIAFSAGTDAPEPPKSQIVVPKLPKAPIVDGKITDEEWKDAAAVGGFGLHGQGRLASRQSSAWIGYDDNNLYVAVKSTVYPAGRHLINLHKKRDGGFFGDDVIEVLIDPFGGKHPGGVPYFYFIGNSSGVICHDSREMPGIGQSEMTWNGNWQFSNQVDDNWWTAELSIPLKNLEVNDIAQNPVWAVQFSRTYSRPVVWTNWPNIGQINSPSGAAFATFTEELPYMRLLSVERLVNGMKTGALSGEIVNPSKKQSSLMLKIRVLDGENTLAEKDYPYVLDPGGRGTFEFAETADLPEKAVCEMTLTEKTEGKILVYQTFPFLKDTPVPSLQETGKEPDFAYRIRHFPSSSELLVWADIFGHPRQKEIKSAKLAISSKDGGFTESKNFLLSSGGSINQRISLAAFKEGDYEVKLSLLDKDEKIVDSCSKDIVLRNFPWLAAGIGSTDKVLPPWTPLKVEGNTVECWEREYTFNGLGLPKNVRIKGEDILAGPITLSGTADGKPFTISPEADPVFTKKTPAAVSMTGAGKGAKITCKISSTIEYDGMIKVEMEIVPDGTVRIDDLQLVVPFMSEKATLIHAVGDHIRTGQYSGLLPEGEGLVWNSKDNVFHASILGSFMPYIWLGNEEKGFAWAASSDEGWVSDNSRPLHEISRHGEVVQLVNRFISRPVELKGPQKIVFALQATPVKPMPKGWRGWEMNPVGNRRPGTRRMSWNPFRDYFYRDKSAYTFGIYVDDYPKARSFYKKYVDIGDLDDVFWTTTANIFNSGTPEADVFRDEWFQGTTGQFDSNSYDMRSFGEDRERYQYGVASLLPSVIDMRLWAIRELLRNKVVNGMYEDNTFLWPVLDEDLGIGYQRDDGEWQSDFMLFNHREYRKRMAGIFHELGLEPLIYSHLTTSLMAPVHSFSTIAYDGEWREISDDGSDFMDKWPNDYFRAVDLWQHNGLVPLWLPMAHGAKLNLDKHTRTMLAVLQLHDILCDNGHCAPEELEKMWESRAKFGISDDDVVFYGYWDVNNKIKPADDDIMISYWQKNDRLMMVLANFAREDRKSLSRISNGISVKSMERIYDAQNGEEFLFRQDGKDTVFDTTVPMRDYRLLIIE